MNDVNENSGRHLPGTRNAFSAFCSRFDLSPGPDGILFEDLTQPRLTQSLQVVGGDPGRPGVVRAQPGGRGFRCGSSGIDRHRGSGRHRGEIGGTWRPQQQTMAGLDELADIVAAQPVPPFRGGATTAGDEAAELTVAAAIGGEHDQRHPADETELRADDQPRGLALERRMRAHHARHRALVGDRERGVAERDRALGEFLRLRSAAQEAEAAEAVQLGISGRRRQILGWQLHTVFIYSLCSGRESVLQRMTKGIQ